MMLLGDGRRCADTEDAKPRNTKTRAAASTVYPLERAGAGSCQLPAWACLCASRTQHGRRRWDERLLSRRLCLPAPALSSSVVVAGTIDNKGASNSPESLAWPAVLVSAAAGSRTPPQTDSLPIERLYTQADDLVTVDKGFTSALVSSTP
ncbi:hypothetical protein BDV95DRAFT_583785, partial [Massariosphaeria phaeospora]